MKKVKENVASDLKNAFGKEVSNLNLLQGGGDSMIAVNDMASAIPQNEEEEIIKRKIYKSPVKKLVGTKKINKPINKITSMKPIMGESETNEKWSEKYKKSIDCNNPKGFSQKAHCQGKVKKGEATEAAGAISAGGYETGLFTEPKKVDMFKDEQPKTKVKGGFVYESDDNSIENLSEAERTIRARLRDIAIKHVGKDIENKTKKEKFEKVYRDLIKQYHKGVKVEKEHKTGDHKLIALDHLEEDPNYYDKLQKIEANEATGTASSGSYVTTAAWAKSSKKKDWKGLSKTQIPGGKFVQVKKKCKKFPYCNQGDIKALNLFENEQLRKAIKNVSVRHNISENVIKNILIWEYENSRNIK
jgi:hypothetical protein